MIKDIDFTEEQKKLADKLLDELLESCRELEKFSQVSVCGIEFDEEEPSQGDLFLRVGFGDPEENGGTIFYCY